MNGRDIPPPPDGFTIVEDAQRPSRRNRPARLDSTPPPPPGFALLDDDHPEAAMLLGRPTGRVHDGDTFGIEGGDNARLYGADAFELTQTGRARNGAIVPLGERARETLLPFADPSATVTATGGLTYGRPVASLDNGGDAAEALLRGGMAIATPEYLKGDPEHLSQYMEAERDARQNRRGAWQTQFEQPASYRHGTPDPWAKPIAGTPGDREAVFWDEPLPFQGMRPEIAQGYEALQQDPDATSADLLAYAKANGFQIDPAAADRYMSRRFDPRYKTTVGTRYGTAPRLLTDTGDGATGAAVRGIADPFNLLDEAGGVASTLLPSDRENVWSSDRRFGDILANNTDQWRSILDFDAAFHPVARLAGQVAGGLVLPGASIEGVGLAAGRKALLSGASQFAARGAAERAVLRRLGVAGAVEGGIAGAGAGEDAQSRIEGAALGAPLGGALGVGVGLVAPRVIAAINRRAARGSETAASASAGQPSPPPVPASREVDRIDVSPMDSARVPDRIDVARPMTRNSDLSASVPLDTSPPAAPTMPVRQLPEVQSEIDQWAAQARQGRPDVMLHGSPMPNIDAFDPAGRGGYGLFGTGTYLTDSAQIAAQYSAKGMTKAARDAQAERTLYAVRQAVKNPLDMDAAADVDGWRRVWSAWGEEPPTFPPGVTNEAAWREVEEYVTDLGIPRWDGAEMMDGAVRTMGYDGITHVGGGRVNKDGLRHRVVIALDPEQTEIVDRLSLDQLMRPADARRPDWIDANADVRSTRRRDRLDAGSRPLAMDAETSKPTLLGPEVAADLPINAGPRPLLQTPPPAERALQAERVSPSDVMPVPAGRVSSLAEADSITAGRVVPVRAPDERDVLSSTSTPSRKTGSPIVTRGPLDLVSWLRTQGGVRPQGGELHTYGIDNARRPGLDFAGGESRLGPLVADGGLSFDDAAMRAWEAGYFPQHVERPTVAEFLDVLGATHSGQSRAFRVDDLAEVEAFEAARQQRYNVEGAQQRGAPMVEDKGQPISLKDLESSSAPVSAYEEWGENAPRLAGNIRLDLLDSPQAIKRALVSSHDRVGGFDAATRGRITHAETKALAADLGMTADDLISRRSGQALNAEEALAARQILARSATDLVNIARRVQSADTPGDELEAAFRQAWLRHVAIQEQVSGATAEAGRALSQFRAVADARAIQRVLPSLGNIAGGPTRIKDAADLILENAADPAALNQNLARALRPRMQDKLVELYYNALLSGPQTHVVNMVSNTITSLGQIPEHAVAATIGAARRAVLREKADVDRVLFKEVGARAIGLVHGTREGMRQALRTLRTGEPLDAVSKVEQRTQEAISGRKGSVIRIPTRLLAAEDELFKGMARRMELTGLAVRQAGKEGLTGEAAKARTAELVANPPDQMLSRSFDYGRYVTFQRELGPLGRLASQATEIAPALKLIVPFVRTPTNLLKFAIERSPAAPILREWRQEVAAGGASRDLAVAKAMIGSGVGAMMFEMAAQGNITGGGPADDSARRLLLANGWQPYSLKVGDRYYSYQRLDPYSTTLGTAADMVDLGSHMTDKQRDHSAMLFVTAILHNLSSKTWLSGLSSALEALNDPERNFQGFTDRVVGGLATPAILAQTARVTDPILREARGPIDRIRSRFPGLSSDLFPRRDVFGRPVRSEGGVGPDILSPIWTSTGRSDPTIDRLLKADIRVSKPAKRVGGVELSPADYDEYQAVAGSLTKARLDVVTASPQWNRMDEEARSDIASKTIRDARRDARRSLGRNKVEGGRSTAIPPPPPGFELMN